MQKEIQLTDKTLLVVSVPKEASDLTLPKVGIADLYFRTDDKEYEDGYISIGIPQGYELLGIYPELTEEELATIGLDLESIQSLMERENITGYDKYAILIKSK